MAEVGGGGEVSRSQQESQEVALLDDLNFTKVQYIGNCTLPGILAEIICHSVVFCVVNLCTIVLVICGIRRLNVLLHLVYE